jgi:hypothetical protein
MIRHAAVGGWTATENASREQPQASTRSQRTPRAATMLRLLTFLAVPAVALAALGDRDPTWGGPAPPQAGRPNINPHRAGRQQQPQHAPGPTANQQKYSQAYMYAPPAAF